MPRRGHGRSALRPRKALGQPRQDRRRVAQIQQPPPLPRRVVGVVGQMRPGLVEPRQPMTRPRGRTAPRSSWRRCRFRGGTRACTPCTRRRASSSRTSLQRRALPPPAPVRPTAPAGSCWPARAGNPRSAPVTRNDGHISPPSGLRHSPEPSQREASSSRLTAAWSQARAPPFRPARDAAVCEPHAQHRRRVHRRAA